MVLINTIILGASKNPARYAFIATQRLQAAGHEIYLIGGKEGMYNENIPIHTSWPTAIQAETVTMYLRPELQQMHEEALIAHQPKRVIFNPGTENPELEQRLKKNGIATLNACTLVLLSTKTYETAGF